MKKEVIMNANEEDKELKKWLSSTGLSGDAYNMIYAIQLAIEEFKDITMLKPIPTYEEYIRTFSGVLNVERLIEISNQQSIKNLNELIAKYNTDLPRIKTENDQKAVIDFHNKADKLIRGDKAIMIS